MSPKINSLHRSLVLGLAGTAAVLLLAPPAQAGVGSLYMAWAVYKAVGENPAINRTGTNKGDCCQCWQQIFSWCGSCNGMAQKKAKATNETTESKQIRDA